MVRLFFLFYVFFSILRSSWVRLRIRCVLIVFWWCWVCLVIREGISGWLCWFCRLNFYLIILILRSVWMCLRLFIRRCWLWCKFVIWMFFEFGVCCFGGIIWFFYYWIVFNILMRFMIIFLILRRFFRILVVLFLRRLFCCWVLFFLLKFRLFWLFFFWLSFNLRFFIMLLFVFCWLVFRFFISNIFFLVRIFLLLCLRSMCLLWSVLERFVLFRMFRFKVVFWLGGILFWILILFLWFVFVRWLRRLGWFWMLLRFVLRVLFGSLVELFLVVSMMSRSLVLRFKRKLRRLRMSLLYRLRRLLVLWRMWVFLLFIEVEDWSVDCFNL